VVGRVCGLVGVASPTREALPTRPVVTVMPRIEYFTFDLENGKRAGLLRRSPGSIEVVSDDGWVDHPDGLKYFEGFGGDQLDVVELTLEQAQAKEAELGVDL
jgi:hypothetical protein